MAQSKLVPLLTLAALGAAAWLVLGAGKSPSVITSGTVTLAARVPYRLTLETNETLSAYPMNPALVDRQSEVRTELLALSAFEVEFSKAASGQSLVTFRMTPVFDIPLTIGSQLNPNGKWGPKLLLTKVERLDGKPI